MDRTCKNPECSNSLEGYYGQARYCSDACWNRAHYLRNPQYWADYYQMQRRLKEAPSPFVRQRIKLEWEQNRNGLRGQ